MKAYLALLILSLTCVQFVGAIEFWYSIPVKKVSCFGDSLGEKITVQIDIYSEDHNYQYRVYDPEGTQLHAIAQNPTANEKLSFVTEKEGNYQFCFTNFRATPQLVKYNYRTGVETNDFLDLSAKEDLEPISLEVLKLEELFANIGREKRMVTRQSRHLHSSTDDISFKVMAFSVITLLLLGVLAAFQAVYLKTFFKSKKLI